MRVEEISNLEALGFAAALLFAAYVLYRFIPGDAPRLRPRERFTDDEISRYDRALPKYGVVSLLALVVAGAHAAFKSLPGVHAWLEEGGHGGHLVRDIANTHLMIVVGGTVAATALTWYVLPRVLGRPLFSERLASIAFWGTVVGATGFYLVNVVTGLVASAAQHGGTGWYETNEAFGAWRAVPVGISATIMGIGYWTFVANVLLTVRAARRLEHRSSEHHLAKFFVVGATGLLIGTVQGVIQVMPSQEQWLHTAGSAGEYIDPIAHAHVNLVTGTLVLVAGAAFWWSRDAQGAVAQRRTEQAVFWLLVPSSLAFYVVFMTLGFVEGGLMVREGISFLAAVERLGIWHTAPLALSGALVLAGIWSFVAVTARRYWRSPRPGARIIVAAMALLAVGTSQGMVQLLPAVKRWFERIGEYGDAIANAHAQLNMLGGVMLALLGLLILGAEPLLGGPVPAPVVDRLARRSVPGVVLYYLAAMATAATAGWAALEPSVPRENAVTIVVGPLGMTLGAAAFTAGFLALAVRTWTATALYREVGWRRFRHAVERYDGGRPAWIGHVRWPVFVVGELVGAIAGFPGFGWIVSGRAVVGLPLALLGPAVAWGVFPAVLSSRAADHDFLIGPALYLVTTAALSTLTLALSLNRRTRRWQQA